MIFFPNANPTRLRASTSSDPYGNEEEDWGSATEVEYTDWHIQPMNNSESDDAERNQIVTRYLAFAPDGVDVRVSDRIRWDDVVFEVEADPRVWPSPFGGVHHIELILRRVEG